MLLPFNIDSDINSAIFGDNEQNPLFPSPLAIKIGLEIFKYLESLDRGQAKLVCRKWKQLIDKIHIIERYNIRLMNAAEVRQEATHYLRNSEKLKAEQRFLLTIVKLSKDCIKIKVAAANALMILKKTNFFLLALILEGFKPLVLGLPGQFWIKLISQERI
ncbi:F-box protein [Candidatus Protochlamydia sp. W-9]|uniref:F-box protein n=1 Tax=Candidatus Protochlamydia sp. W-9 TaxID=1785087 RepID=UPI000A4F8957|nr:F-box protein [Candidatus Protochlamydia sp. W-9]